MFSLSVSVKSISQREQSSSPYSQYIYFFDQSSWMGEIFHAMAVSPHHVCPAQLGLTHAGGLLNPFLLLHGTFLTLWGPGSPSSALLSLLGRCLSAPAASLLLLPLHLLEFLHLALPALTTASQALDEGEEHKGWSKGRRQGTHCVFIPLPSLFLETWLITFSSCVRAYLCSIPLCCILPSGYSYPKIIFPQTSIHLKLSFQTHFIAKFLQRRRSGYLHSSLASSSQTYWNCPLQSHKQRAHDYIWKLPYRVCLPPSAIIDYILHPTPPRGALLTFTSSMPSPSFSVPSGSSSSSHVPQGSVIGCLLFFCQYLLSVQFSFVSSLTKWL